MNYAVELTDVSVTFGGLHALNSLSCTVPEKQLRGVIGPNGSGKTTLLNVISGVYPASKGEIRLFGDDITQTKSHLRAKMGVVRTYQDASLIKELTVLENVMLGLIPTTRQPLFHIAFRTPRYRATESEMKGTALEALEYVGIQFLADKKGDELSGGQMRLVEIARALAARPKLLLLDEPAAGLSLIRIDEVKELIRKINEDMGVTIILVEHVLNMVMTLCEEITVLVSGEHLVSGSPESVQQDMQVREAYLGKSAVQ